MNKETSMPKAIRHVETSLTPKIFAEGMSQLLVGYPHSKIILYVDSTDDNNQLQRELSCEIVMPTASVIKFAQNIINSLSIHKSNLLAAKLEEDKAFEKLVSSLEEIPNTNTKVISSEISDS